MLDLVYTSVSDRKRGEARGAQRHAEDFYTSEVL